MTRDETRVHVAALIKLINAGATKFHAIDSTSDAVIDQFVALGMLKLDEPLISRSSPEYKLYDAIFEHIPTLDFMPFKKLIDEANLKIIEK